VADLVAWRFQVGVHHDAHHLGQGAGHGHLLRAHERDGSESEFPGSGGREVADDVGRAGAEDGDDVVDIEIIGGDDGLDELLGALVEVGALVCVERGGTTDSADGHGGNRIGATQGSTDELSVS